MTDYYSDTYSRLSDSYVISQDISVMQAEAMQAVELRVATSLGNSPTFRELYNVPVVPGNLTPGPVSGEIVDPSGGVVTVPVVTLPAHPADYVTMTGLLNAISEGPQSHDGARKGGGRVPGWALVCLFAGLVLIGLSMVGAAWLSMR